ncbi:MAG TPA: ATP-dependent DNA helicase RecG [Firmicutes bacterium]|nr:ATP-dependent DNA helicase RecG [Bacillota bacterium]
MTEKQFLDSPVTVLQGVGPKRAQTIKKLGLFTVRDVLYSFPRSYKDFTQTFQPHEAIPGETQLITGSLTNLRERHISRGRRLIQAQLQGEEWSLTPLNLTWFVFHRGAGPSYLYRRLNKAKQLWVFGQVTAGLRGPEMASAEFFLKQPRKGLFPVYPLVATVSNAQRVAWVETSLKHLEEIDEILPQFLNTFMSRREALRQIHFPKNHALQKQARERLVFEEFFLFHLGLQLGRQAAAGVKHRPDGKLVAKYLKNLPFTLTNDQKSALTDVAGDMESTLQMRRLIQGEVGSGKTVVAEYACIKAVENGGQAAMMVPTEVLARQMAERFQAALEPLGITTELLVGNMPNKAQEQVRQGIAAGEIDVVVGTHALITEKVDFKNLTLAIVDEQHRFGVRQRLALLGKGNADLLVMSATPIPRSLALTAYGDLDTTEIRELPKGRHVVDTRLVHPNKRADVYRYVVSRVRLGQQAFVVFPLVEESEHLDLKAAVQEMEDLKKGYLRSVRVGLVHGQMGKEKEEIMAEFLRGEIDVLIATTVIEVGMNVPNATVMVIENAERFGLAQLHQLRGRVGRGSEPGICFLLPYSFSEQSKERLNVIRRSNDGFHIAEADLKLRGPGDLLGVRQWGQPLFKIGDIVEDRDILKKSAQQAHELLEKDPTLAAFPRLQAEIKRQRT